MGQGVRGSRVWVREKSKEKQDCNQISENSFEQHNYGKNFIGNDLCSLLHYLLSSRER